MSAKKQKEQKSPARPPQSREKMLRELESQGKGRLNVSRHSEKAALALWDIAKPVIKKGKKRAQVEQGLRTAMFAWNLSILPDDKRKEMFDQAISQVKWPFRWFMRRMIISLMDRKKELYPKEFRMIADIEISGEAPNWNVKVATVQAATR